MPRAMQKSQLLYIQAKNPVDQKDWLTCIETNITKMNYLVAAPPSRGL